MKILIFLILFLIVFCCAKVEAKTSHDFVDSLAGFQTGFDDGNKVVKKLGKGAVLPAGHDEWSCYYLPREDSYLLVGTFETIIEEMTLLKVSESKSFEALKGYKDGTLKTCKNKPVKAIKAITGKGLLLGDPPDKVTKIYGKPMKETSEKGILKIEYHTDSDEDPDVKANYDLYLYFKDNKLFAITVYDGC